MKITTDFVVSVEYTLSANTLNQPETLVEQTDIKHPFVFLYGHHGVLPEFELQLKDKAVNDPFDFYIEAENAYGHYENEYHVNLEKQIFQVDGVFDTDRVFVGNRIEMNDANGQPLEGVVTEISASHVKMDFNHPLAGQRLHFVGRVLDVRKATDEELAHGHVHGPHGHHH
ncbi:MAG: peptidylprolyl isomerase [Bacteroidota bacterium]|jgi:FKBP-type peptidyl-prolyl cis-trans isomerase SlyD